ncbi:MAG: hypothetical protein JW885_06045 [Deltaproteobacteria bacterium]|nr:hypothetical protein [Candidatus Zymogenaceae bacterium]
MRPCVRVLAGVFSLLAVLVCGGVAAGQDYLYIRNSTVSDTPKIIENFDGAPGEIVFLENPALLRLDSSFRFLSDVSYRGSYSDVSTRDIMYSNGHLYPVGTVIGSSDLDSRYVTNTWGTDIGFALKINSNMNLAFVFEYLSGETRGDTDIYTDTLESPILSHYFWGSGENGHRSNRYASTLLLSWEAADALSLGVGVTHNLYDDTRKNSINGLCKRVSPLPIFNLTYNIESEEILSLDYHGVSPFLGVSYAPSECFRLETSLGLDMYTGSVSKEAEISAFGNDYSEDVDSGDLDGWGMRGDIKLTAGLNERVSIPVRFSVSYNELEWNTNGAGYGNMFNGGYWYFIRGRGPIEYENDFEAWDMSAGVGIKYTTDGLALSFVPMYTHRVFTNDYNVHNRVTGGSNPAGDYLFTQSDREEVDVLSLDVRVEKRFSEECTGELGLRYDWGWVKRDYDVYLTNPLEFVPGNYLDATSSGKDQYHDLTLSTELFVTPVQNLTITLSGMVTIPLEPLDYDLSGSVTGTDPTVTNTFYNTNGIARDYKDSSWVYGGMLEVIYEF